MLQGLFFRHLKPYPVQPPKAPVSLSASQRAILWRTASFSPAACVAFLSLVLAQCGNDVGNDPPSLQPWVLPWALKTESLLPNLGLVVSVGPLKTSVALCFSLANPFAACSRPSTSEATLGRLACWLTDRRPAWLWRKMPRFTQNTAVRCSIVKVLWKVKM